MKTVILAACLALAASGAGLAQGMDHSTMDHSAMPAEGAAATANPSTQAFEAANEAMHAGMAVELTGDADVDFARSMIPHHQGAIDMARIVLADGEDPELRALAEEIVAAQEAEIAEMNRWLVDNGHEPGPSAQ